jgi:hypothetical protein
MRTARLDKTRMRALCGHCSRPIARISQYPEDTVADHTLSFDQRVRAGLLDEYASERAFVLESGWVSRKDGTWELSDYTKHRLDRAKWQATGNDSTFDLDKAKARERIQDLSAMRARGPSSKRLRQ